MLGHPRGLGTLFFTELWERFSYYGMRSILILYMTSAAAQGGLGFSVKDAASPASLFSAGGRVSVWWLVALYFFAVCGEMCLSPVGLSTVTKLAPVKLVGIMMGIWFLAASFGNKLAGYLSGFFDSSNPSRLAELYGGIAVGLLVSAGILALLTPAIKRMMGRVR